MQRLFDMNKYYKERLYKKYNDEIWGSLITSKKFSYNKKSILLNYRDLSLRKRIRIKTKYNYYRLGFLKRLNYTLFTFKSFRKSLRLVNFLFKKRFMGNTSAVSKLYFYKTFKRRFRSRRYKKMMFSKKSLVILKTSLYSLSSISRFISKTGRINLLFNLKGFNFFPAALSSQKTQVYRNFVKFLRVNNLRYSIRKKLNLKKEKSFFYSVHIAAPRKKLKRWSLYGLKSIYYKKVALFFGFKKVADFFKLYNSVLGIWGKNESFLFSVLEGRLDNVLFRLNYFPSIYFIKRFILSGNLFINNKVVNYPCYFLNPGEIVSINKNYFKFAYYSIKARLKSKKVLLNLPSFIEADYKLLVAMVIRNPSVSDLTMPVSFDLYTSFVTFNK